MISRVRGNVTELFAAARLWVAQPFRAAFRSQGRPKGLRYDLLTIVVWAVSVIILHGQSQPDWKALEPEMMSQFQAVLRFDTRNPPGNEHLVADYLKGVFDKAGIPAQIFSLDANRSNVVARLKGNGKKKPILILGHSDVVTVDEAKWKFPPFSATRDGVWVYARGTVDDKDNLTGGLMTMLLLKRFNVTLDRDVIFLSEAGEEGASNFGMQFMVNQHFPEIESEYCLAEGGGAIRIGGVAKYTTVETLEKIPRGIELVAHGISGHGSIPLKSNAIVHLAGAVARVGRGGRAGRGGARARVPPLHPPPPPLSPAPSRPSRRPRTRSTTATCCRPTP